MNISNNIKPPCKNCPSRDIGCHNGCNEYAIYQSKLNAFKKRRNALCQVNRDVIMSMHSLTRSKNF